MKRRFRNGSLANAVTATVLVWGFSVDLTSAEPGSGSTADWPQWRGPNRDGLAPTSHIAKAWTEAGPKQVWRRPLGEGFSGISVSGSRAYTMYATQNNEYVVCLNTTDGSEVWSLRTGAKFMEGHGNGPRCTPTIDGDRIYTMGASGELLAVEAETGQVIWKHNLRRKFKSQRPSWGFTSSPLIEGNMVLVEGGGSGERSLMAFDKESGDVVWTAGSDPIGYSSPIPVDVHGVRQILFFTGSALVSVAPLNGQIYWRYEWPNDHHINPASPVFIGPDRVFVSSGYDTGGAVVEITKTEAGPGVSEVWFSKGMQNHFNSSIHHEGFLYGFDDSIFKCIAADTGEEQWKTRGYGKGSLMFADGHLIVLSDDGKLALVEANPTTHVEVARAQVLSGRCWTSPSLARGLLYLRSLEEIVCLDMRGQT